jgi:hypothetical protein
VAPNWGFASMVVGGGSAVLAFYINKMQLLPELPGGFLDRVGSWVLALAIAFVGWRRANR